MTVTFPPFEVKVIVSLALTLIPQVAVTRIWLVPDGPSVPLLVSIDTAVGSWMVACQERLPPPVFWMVNTCGGLESMHVPICRKNTRLVGLTDKRGAGAGAVGLLPGGVVGRPAGAGGVVPEEGSVPGAGGVVPEEGSALGAGGVVAPPVGGGELPGGGGGLC